MSQSTIMSLAMSTKRYRLGSFLMRIKPWIIIPLMALSTWLTFSPMSENLAIQVLRLARWAGYPLDNHTIALIAVGGVVAYFTILGVFAVIADYYERGCHWMQNSAIVKYLR